MTALVTGSAGQVGHELVRALRASGHDVHGADVVDRPDELQVDVSDRDGVARIVKDVKPQRVYHLAAILSARGEDDPALAYRTNVTGTINVLDACREAGVAQVIFTSSIAVYGPDKIEHADEDAPARPITMYGITKLSGELLGEYYHRRWGLDFRAVRFPALVAPTKPGGGASDYVIAMYVDAIRRGSCETRCRADTRISLMHIDDGVRALVELADAPAHRLSRRVYNIGGFSPTAQQIAQSIQRVAPNTQISFREDPQAQKILDSWPASLDDPRAQSDWDWSAKLDLDSTTRKVIEALT